MFLAEEEKINYVEIYGAFSITKAYIARDEWWGGGAGSGGAERGLHYPTPAPSRLPVSPKAVKWLRNTCEGQ